MHKPEASAPDSIGIHTVAGVIESEVPASATCRARALGLTMGLFTTEMISHSTLSVDPGRRDVSLLSALLRLVCLCAG